MALAYATCSVRKMIPKDWQEYAAYVEDFKHKRNKRYCQCDVEDVGTCPGPNHCTNAPQPEGEETHEQAA